MVLRAMGFVTNPTFNAINLNTRDTDGNATQNANDTMICAHATDGPVNVVLLPANTQTGRVIFVKKSDATANVVTVVPDGTDKINGANDYALPVQHDCIILQSSGDGWDVVKQK